MLPCGMGLVSRSVFSCLAGSFNFSYPGVVNGFYFSPKNLMTSMFSISISTSKKTVTSVKYGNSKVESIAKVKSLCYRWTEEAIYISLFWTVQDSWESPTSTIAHRQRTAISSYGRVWFRAQFLA